MFVRTLQEHADRAAARDGRARDDATELHEHTHDALFARATAWVVELCAVVQLRCGCRACVKYPVRACHFY
eukprot:10877552-Lingulodinium_polyedra.AAC.1